MCSGFPKRSCSNKKSANKRIGCGDRTGVAASCVTTGEEHTMKLLHFDDFKLGVLKGEAVIDVSAEVRDIPHTGPGDLMNGLIERWDSYRPRLEAAVSRGAGVPVSGV